ncbi:hypothetical protein [Thioclava sp. GXIMD4216]|uniref:tetratricopeptide repeat protein n=1 Tax=Thioclava sp. GXIMD4216 TaxID=3131929 RepID=UPI0030D1AFB1
MTYRVHSLAASLRFQPSSAGLSGPSPRAGFLRGRSWARHGLRALAVGTLWGLAQTASAKELVAVDFEPPVIEMQSVCAPRLSDEQIEDRWKNWDRKTLAGRNAEEVRGDMRRLMEVDAAEWKPVYARVIALLPQIDPSFDADKQLFETIAMRVAAGEAAAVKSEGLVRKALDTPGAKLPHNQRRLGEYLVSGQGIDKDRMRGIGLLVEAARGGDAQALLTLADFQNRGVALPNWTVDPQMTIMLGFAAQVGAMNPTICDRVINIARAYNNGELVQPDYALAEKWYRFAADLGDGNAAYAVAEMHLRSEKIKKNNEVMLKYLHQAAKNGSPSVLIALGRLYEEGALIGQDLGKAEALYDQAAASGARGALVRQALFLEKRADVNPNYKPRFEAALTHLLARDDAPGWAYARAGQMALERKGRWAGQDEALALWEKGVALGDAEAIRGRARVAMSLNDKMDTFYSGVDDLIFAVEQMGKTGAVRELVDAHLCLTPQGPLPEQADYWSSMADPAALGASETLTAVLGRVEEAQVPDLPREIARKVMAHAQDVLPASPQLADLATLATNPALSDAEQAYWTRVAGLLQVAAPQSVQDYVTLLQPRLLMQFAQLYPASADTPALLLALAQQGNGVAMEALMTADPAHYPDEASVLAAFDDVIRDRGDFDASLLALAHAAPEDQALWLRHAKSEMACIFPQARELAMVAGRVHNTAALKHWIAVSEALARHEKPWARTQIADLYAIFKDQLGEDAALTAQQMYLAAYEAGDRTAIMRLLPKVEKPGKPGFDPARAAELYVALAQRSDGAGLSDVVARINGAEPAVKRAIGDRIDPRALYLRAAEAGDTFAMYQYAALTRDKARTPADIADAELWLGRAAEGGNVDAMIDQARSLAFGITGTPDPDAARGWLVKAAALGNEEASGLLNSMQLGKVPMQ